jgi:hypothetical protein
MLSNLPSSDGQVLEAFRHWFQWISQISVSESGSLVYHLCISIMLVENNDHNHLEVVLLQIPVVKFEDPLVVPGGGFQIRDRIQGNRKLTQSSALILSGSFAFAVLAHINQYLRNHRRGRSCIPEEI